MDISREKWLTIRKQWRPEALSRSRCIPAGKRKKKNRKEVKKAPTPQLAPVEAKTFLPKANDGRAIFLTVLAGECTESN